MIAPLIPADLAAQVRSWVPSGKVQLLESTVGGFSNLSFLARINGEKSVVKAASADLKRADIRREAEILGRLAESEVPFPVPTAVVLLEGGWTVLITRHFEGTSAIERRPGPAGLRIRAEILGRLLATIHATSIAPDRASECGLNLVERADSAAGMVQSSDLPDRVRAQLIASLQDPIMRKGMALVHGDFGLHNVLWVEGPGRAVRLGLIHDWEWAGWGNPLVDIAWLWWSFQHRKIGEEPWRAFVAGYGAWAMSALGWSPETVTTLVRAQMAHLILRTSPGSGPRAEWLSRLSTLTTYAVPKLPSGST